MLSPAYIQHYQAEQLWRVRAGQAQGRVDSMLPLAEDQPAVRPAIRAAMAEHLEAESRRLHEQAQRWADPQAAPLLDGMLTLKSRLDRQNKVFDVLCNVEGDLRDKGLAVNSPVIKSWRNASHLVHRAAMATTMHMAQAKQALIPEGALNAAVDRLRLQTQQVRNQILLEQPMNTIGEHGGSIQTTVAQSQMVLDEALEQLQKTCETALTFNPIQQARTAHTNLWRQERLTLHEQANLLEQSLPQASPPLTASVMQPILETTDSKIRHLTQRIERDEPDRGIPYSTMDLSI